jgi:hypothetical protein
MDLWFTIRRGAKLKRIQVFYLERVQSYLGGFDDRNRETAYKYEESFAGQ